MSIYIDPGVEPREKLEKLNIWLSKYIGNKIFSLSTSGLLYITGKILVGQRLDFL